MIASVAALNNRAGRPRVAVDPEQIHQLRSQHMSWRRIAKELGIGTATAMRLFKACDGSRPNIEETRPKTSDQI
jgi:hypothetical protein